MNLLEQAQADAAAILGNSTSGFAKVVTVQDPNGVLGDVAGFLNNTHRAVDPETGALVSMQSVTFVASMAAFLVAGFSGYPEAIADNNSAPWVLTDGATRWRVKRVEPDETLQAVTLFLESYF